MNAKQRKVAGKMRERAMLDADAKLQRAIEAESVTLAGREKLAQDAEKFKLFVAEQNERLAKDREALKIEAKEQAVRNEQMVNDQLVAIDIEKHTFREKVKHFKDGVILRDVLLQLEMDVSPEEIALNLRREHNLLIPVW